MTSEKPDCSDVYDTSPPVLEEQISDAVVIADLRHDNDLLRQTVADLLKRIRDLEEGRS